MSSRSLPRTMWSESDFGSSSTQYCPWNLLTNGSKDGICSFGLKHLAKSSNKKAVSSCSFLHLSFSDFPLQNDMYWPFDINGSIHVGITLHASWKALCANSSKCSQCRQKGYVQRNTTNHMYPPMFEQAEHGLALQFQFSTYQSSEILLIISCIHFFLWVAF